MNVLLRVFRQLTGLPKRKASQTRPNHFKPVLEQLDERLLPTLTPVTPTGSLQAIVELQVTYPDNQTVVGTGAMVDSSHVLTAAHLLYSAKDGGYAASVEAIPAANGSNDPFGVTFGTYERVDASWLSFSKSNAGMTSPSVVDIGLVTLNRAIGKSTGWFSLGHNNSNAFFAGATFQTAGYPDLMGLSGPQMYSASGKALGTVASDGIGFSQSSLTALPGQSGSPIYQTSSSGSPVIYGVLTGANGLSSTSEVYAARITPSVYSELQGWEKADKMPPTFSTVISANQAALQHPLVSATQLKSVATSTTTIYALDGTFWNPYSNLLSNSICIMSNWRQGNWTPYSRYFPTSWPQMIAPAPPNCIYYSYPSNTSSYLYNDYYDDDFYYYDE
jgi:V8-like Glu-specific endopeptidase